MVAKMAYLGWGSLLWNYKDLKIGEWEKTSLKLPLEFSRISQDGRLTLVIDEENGAENNIWMTPAKYKNIDLAINALKKREKTLKGAISYVNLPKKKYRIRNTSPKIAQQLVMWALKEGLDVIIWTDLSTNWEKVRDKKYTVDDAIKYFKSTPVPTQMKIFDYVYGANQVGKITTPFSIEFFKFLSEYLKDLVN